MFYSTKNFKKGWGYEEYLGTNKKEAMNSREFTRTKKQMSRNDPFWETRGEWDHSQIDTYKTELDYFSGKEPIKTQTWY